MFNHHIILCFLLALCNVIAGQQGIAGDSSAVDVNRKDIQNYTSYAVAKINLDSNSSNYKRLVKVLHGTERMVAGFVYQLTILLGLTDCDKDEVKFEPQNLDIGDKCDFKAGSFEMYLATIYSRPSRPQDEYMKIELVK
uniref:Cystatin domain-containing protein n=1 Tax=Ditylenchus dipsaci TaxID=166011 RepID=A0A915D414_9BILA